MKETVIHKDCGGVIEAYCKAQVIGERVYRLRKATHGWERDPADWDEEFWADDDELTFYQCAKCEKTWETEQPIGGEWESVEDNQTLT